MTQPSPSASLQDEQKSVLIVDDETAIADTLAVILRNAGYHAVALYDPLKALQCCQAACPDLVISDVMMPAMNGIEMAVQIQRLCPDAQVLLFSGMAVSYDLLAEARTRGHSFELLSKPVHPGDLLAKIKPKTASVKLSKRQAAPAEGESA